MLRLFREAALYCGSNRFLTESNTVQMSPLLSLIRFLLRNDTQMLSLCESCPCSWAHESLQSNFSSENALVSHNTLVFCAICDVTACDAIVLAERKMETLFGCQIRTLRLEKYPMQRVLLSKTYIFRLRES